LQLFKGKNYQIKPAIIVIILLVFVVTLYSFSCKAEPSNGDLPSETTPSVEIIAPSESILPGPGQSEGPVVEPSPGKVAFSATPEIKELEDSNWISPGKIEVGNLYPGATAEYPITVHNGGDVTTEFSISVRTPDNTTEGYEPFPQMYFDWIVIEKPQLELEAKQTADVLIVVNMPEDADYSGKQVEFWIGVIDQGQSGMVRTELACRWLISTK
jgi:hypothetical protein